jgi:hypothetical protein
VRRSISNILQSSVIPVIVAAVCAIACPAEGAIARWDASSGVLPDSACPAWIAAVGDSMPRFSGGALRIKTTQCQRSTSYRQVSPDVQIPDTLIVEVRLRLETGTECQGPCGHYRQGAGVAITVAPQIGTLFFVGNDEIFITNGECGGITNALVDTNNQAHTYRIVVLHGTTVTVRYDGTPILSGHTYNSSADHGDNPRILWGEGSYLAFGTSYWEYVWHNAHATGCGPTSVEDGALAADMSAAPSVRAFPNPFLSATTLRYVVAQPGRVRIDLFDVSGRRVRSLLDADRAPGTHLVRWDGLDEAGGAVIPGSYVIRLATPEGEWGGKALRLR